MHQFFITDYDIAHNINILIHISFGAVAIILGSIQLLNQKGGMLHKRMGRWFLVCFTVIIATGLIGVFVFFYRAFLTVLTLAAAYNCISGVRTLRLKGVRPKKIDNGVSVFALCVCFIFHITVDSSQTNTSIITIYATLTSLVIMNLYDVSRNLLPLSWLQKHWLSEHIVKMISAFSALLSAVTGNLLPDYAPFSQLAPSIIGVALMALFIRRISMKRLITDNQTT